MKDIKAYQKAYYISHREKLRKKHREYGQKVRAGLIIPVKREEKKEGEVGWKQPECGYCHDLILGKVYHIIFNGQKIGIDHGCFLMAMEGRFRAGEVAVD